MRFVLQLLLCLVSQILYFHFQLGSPQFLMVNSDFWFLLVVLLLTDFFFIESLLALEIPDFAGISSCRILFSICITSFFLLLQLFLLVGVSNSAVSLCCCFSNRLLCCNEESISFCLVPISPFRICFLSQEVLFYLLVFHSLSLVLIDSFY